MNLFEEMARLSSAGSLFVLATVVETGGSSPGKAGAKLLMLADGTLRGTIGGGAIEKQVIEAARELLADSKASTRLLQTHLTHDLGMCCGGRMSVFLEKVNPADQLYVFGAGHVGKELAQLAGQVGFQVTVADEREEWLTAERFPNAQRWSGFSAEQARKAPLHEKGYACVMTHDHALDQEIVEALLRRPLAYVGVIGSQRKAEKFRQRLEAKGFSAAEIARLRSPMGLPIGAQTPEEIAVSIVAELIALRRGERGASEKAGLSQGA